MSLFKARDWWRIQCGSDEEFDSGCLATGRLTSAMHQFVVVGSHAGILRIFKPKKGDAGTESLCLEKDLRNPILAVAIGCLVFDGQGLAVLQDRKLLVFTLSTAQGEGSTGEAYSLKLAYEHSLKKSGYSLCCGPFGKVQNKEFIAVQHLDAAISVFEQESYSFSRYLPNALLPGPLVYIAGTDSFVTGNSARVVEAYRYNSLAVATDAQDDPKAKKVKHDWVFNSGELIMDIRAWPSQCSILVLNYSSVMCLNESGELNWLLRFEVPPAALLPLSNNLAVASSTGQILLYRNNELLWGAQHSSTPVQLQVITCGQVEGLLVALDQSGRCEALYLGTDPSLPIMAPSSSYRDLDVERMDGQLRSLQGRIREATNSAAMPEVKEAADLQLSFRVQPPAQAGRGGQQAPEVTVVVQGKTKSMIQEVQLTVQAPMPIQAEQTRLTFSFVDAANPLEAELKFSLNTSFPCSPSRLDARLVAIFTSTTGSPKCVQASVQLPLAVCSRPAQPEKQAACKLTLETNKSPTTIASLFPELRLGDADASGGSGAAMQFLPDGPTVTMVSSQSAPKYRLQAESLDLLALPLKELRSRLRGQQGDSLTLNLVGGQLPLAEYCACIDWHWQARQHLLEVEEQLEQKAKQYRAIQKRLLGKFKDKTAGPLQNLDLLLESATRQMLSLADEAEQAKLTVRITALKVCAANSVMAELLQLQRPQDQLDAVLSSQLEDFNECGVEEQLDAALTHLLRTALSKSSSSKDANFNASKLETPKDPSKLKKHAQMLCEKLAKGMTIGPLPSSSSSSAAAIASSSRVPASASASLTPSVPLPLIREPQDDAAEAAAARAASDYEAGNNGLSASQFLSPREHKKKKKKKHKHRSHRELEPLQEQQQERRGRNFEGGEGDEEDEMGGERRGSRREPPRELDFASSLLAPAPAEEADDFYG